jgi:hypothetical protein
MARKKTSRTRSPFTGARSPKAPRPPQDTTQSPQARRRRKTAKAAVRKDTMLSEAQRVRAQWAAGKPKEKKR